MGDNTPRQMRPRPALRRHSSTAVVLALLLLDTASIGAAYVWAVFDALPWDVTLRQSLLFHFPYALIFLIVWFAAALDQQLLVLHGSERLGSYAMAVVKAMGAALVISTVVMSMATREGLDHGFLLSFCVAMPATLLVARSGVRVVQAMLQKQGYLVQRVILVGSNPRAQHLAQVISSPLRRYNYRIAGFVEDDRDRAHLLADRGLEYLGGTDRLPDLLEQGGADTVYVCLPVRSFYERIREIAALCEGAGVPVRLVADLFQLRVASNRLMYVEDVPLLSLSAVPETRIRLAVKRVWDFVLSSVLLLALLPLFIFVAILIKLESKGPVFFAQERVGQNQRRFRMLKFRSMVANAEELREELEARNEADGPVFKIRNDPRVTKVGRFIRKYSIDEFPQLINVWRGEMSLVGPRPPLPSEVEKYSWDQRRRLSVRPGMTGLWQVSGRSDVGFDEWVELDLAYIDNWSLLEDLAILMKTFRAVLEHRGAA